MESSRSNNEGEEEVYTEVRSTFVRAYVYDTLTQDYCEINPNEVLSPSGEKRERVIAFAIGGYDKRRVFVIERKTGDVLTVVDNSLSLYFVARKWEKYRVPSELALEAARFLFFSDQNSFSFGDAYE